jgi:hypothetical protein
MLFALVGGSNAVKLGGTRDDFGWPSGLKATEVTEFLCPLKVRISLPVEASHSRAVLSPDPVSTCAPSGLKATDETEYLCPWKARSSFPVAASHRRAV